MATLLIGLTAGGMLYWRELAIRERYVYAGVPRAQAFGQQSLAHVLRNQGFMIGYSELRRNALWVSYHLRPIERRRAGPRPREFGTDWRTLSRVEHWDYSGSGYDRGHLAPNYAIANLYGPDAQRDTFLMSNISPQSSRLNQKVWQRLEEVEIDYFAPWFGELWVFTGPIFDTNVTQLASGVEIPDAFYKVYAIPTEPPRFLAFIIPQGVRGREPLDQFLASVDEVEQRTGLDFFHRLNDPQEKRLEADIDTDGWRLNEVSRLPPRY